MVAITFVTAKGEEVHVEAKEGLAVLDIAQANGIDMEGACEGSMACSTCHVILSDADFDRFAAPKEEEDDLLDLAFGAKPTSRLACQLLLSKAHEGAVFRLPEQTRSLLF